MAAAKPAASTAPMVDVVAVHTIYTGGPTPFAPGAEFAMRADAAAELAKGGHIRMKATPAAAATPVVSSATPAIVTTEPSAVPTPAAAPAPVIHAPEHPATITTEPPHPIGVHPVPPAPAGLVAETEKPA